MSENNKPVRNIIFLKNHDSGSTEHFWHFIFGYLLPLTELLSNLKFESKEKNHSNDPKALIVSCGPLMDRILHEVLPYIYSNYEIVTEEKIRQQYNFLESVIVPRWDKLDFVQIKKRLHHSISRIAESLPLKSCCDVPGHLQGKILIIKRTSQPKFYRRSGEARIRGYGTRRRSLINIKRSAMRLNNKGFPVDIYEPGIHSLGCQIKTFRNASGIIGIRGAEFANIIWAMPGIPVIMVNPATYKYPPPQRNLTQVMGMEYHELHSPFDYAWLNHQDVFKILNRYGFKDKSTRKAEYIPDNKS